MTTTSFKTLSGKEYDLSFNFGILRKVDSWDFSAVSDNVPKILQLSRDEDAKRLYYDLPLIAMIAFAIICEKQKQAGQVLANQEQLELDYCMDIDGEVLESIREAFWSSLENFFPRHLRIPLERIRVAHRIVIDQMARRAPDLDAANERIIRGEIDKLVLEQQQIPGK